MIKRILDTKKQTAAALAEEIFQKINECDDSVNIALSGGSTPAILFSIVAEDYGDKINWRKVRIFWVDERSVPPEDDQSNYKMTARTLLSQIDIPESNVYRIHGENDAGKEAVRYSEVIEQSVPMEKNLPRFDIILLGMGDDGHTASIFPDQMSLLKSDKICERAIHPQNGQERVTMTGSVINNGKNIYFLICGESKVEILVKIRDKDPLYPASYIRSDAIFFLDKSASGKLT